MKCLTEDCANEIENKTGRRKFCSNACKMRYFRKHGKKDSVSPMQVQVLYNAVLDMVGKINYGVNPILNDTPITAKHIYQYPLDEKDCFKPTQKTFQQFMNELSELETEHEYRTKAAEIEASGLTKKQKDLLLLNMRTSKL